MAKDLLEVVGGIQLRGDSIDESLLRRYPSNKCKEDDCWNPCTGGCSVFWLKYDPAKEIKGKYSK